MLNKLLRLLLFEVARSAEASLAILIAGNKLLCSYRDTVCSPLVTVQHCEVTHPGWKPRLQIPCTEMKMNTHQLHWLQDLQQAAYR